MKKSLLILLLALPLQGLAAQNYQIQNIRFSPPEYYVGDTVEMSFIIRTDQLVDIKVPEDLPDPVWINFLSMEVESRGLDSEVHIKLIPYYPGTRTLPPLEMGGLRVDDLKIFTSSLLNLESSRDLEGVQGPLLIPGTRAVGALIVSLMLSLPVVFLLLFRFLRARTGEIIKTYKINLPYRQFQRLIRKIRRTMVNMPEREFYIEFTGGFKKYLSTRFHKDLSSSTTSEIENLLEKSQVHDTLVMSLINLFHRVDRVKFAGEKLMYTDREVLLKESEEVSEALEEWRKSNADL
ncbi:MAG: hypothetical protein PQJ50_16505 [Spirochaetales bacterium]|nr:hypothetical protein [Spirochaetales bacterium]